MTKNLLDKKVEQNKEILDHMFTFSTKDNSTIYKHPHLHTGLAYFITEFLTEKQKQKKKLESES